jgi:hypothetical protein
MVASPAFYRTIAVKGKKRGAFCSFAQSTKRKATKQLKTPAGIFEYIEVFDNRQIRHSAIGYMCHNEYENHTTNQTSCPLFVGKTSKETKCLK